MAGPYIGRWVNLSSDEAIFFDAVSKRCTEGTNALFGNGWKGWPIDTNQEDVLSWFAEISGTLAKMSDQYNPTSMQTHRPLAQPNKPIQGSIAERKLLDL